MIKSLRKHLAIGFVFLAGCQVPMPEPPPAPAPPPEPVAVMPLPEARYEATKTHNDLYMPADQSMSIQQGSTIKIRLPE